MLRQGLSSRLRVLAREFYIRTRHKTFTVNDFRQQRFNELLPSPNAIGAFFRALSAEAFIEKVAQAKVLHKEGKGRWVWSWRWTALAEDRLS